MVLPLIWLAATDMAETCGYFKKRYNYTTLKASPKPELLWLSESQNQKKTLQYHKQENMS
jgi:hypothetical protein